MPSPNLLYSPVRSPGGRQQHVLTVHRYWRAYIASDRTLFLALSPFYLEMRKIHIFVETINRLIKLYIFIFRFSAREIGWWRADFWAKNNTTVVDEAFALLLTSLLPVPVTLLLVMALSMLMLFIVGTSGAGADAIALEAVAPANVNGSAIAQHQRICHTHCILHAVSHAMELN